MLKFNPERLEGFTARLAKPEDSSDFAHWAAENPQIPQKDLIAVTKEKNPTTVSIVVEKEGKVILYIPVYCQLNVGFLGFNPEANRAERVLGMELMQFALCAFAQMHGINEITVQTAKDYPVARWAAQHEFEPESRTTYKLRVTEALSEEATCGK